VKYYRISNIILVHLVVPGVKAAGAFGWRPIILVVLKRQDILGP